MATLSKLLRLFQPVQAPTPPAASEDLLMGSENEKAITRRLHTGQERLDSCRFRTSAQALGKPSNNMNHIHYPIMKLLKFSALVAAVAVTAATVSSVHAKPEIGKPAPEFTLNDTSGKKHSLSDFRGKIVVLEWINHGCPFVVKHYATGNMQRLQETYTGKGVVWLSICSSAPGKEGHMSPNEAAKKSKEVGSKATAYLLDEDGTVGRLYEAKRTPEMFIINQEGILVYMGAIDDKPSADKKTVEGAKNFVAAALDELLAGKPVSTPQTTAYGCSVKYAK